MLPKFSEALYFSVITLWVGGLWVIGYIVAPALFAGLGDRQLAGMMAGRLFTLIGWVGLASAAYLSLFLASGAGRRVFRNALFWLVLAMALITLVTQVGIQPLMAQLKAAALPQAVMESAWRDRFAAWHGVSSILYLLQSLLGLGLVVASRRGQK